jgi:hypothetical protein
MTDREQVNDAMRAMQNALNKEGISNLCFSTSLILNEFYNIVGINSKVVIGYLCLDGTVYLRHVWCDVEGETIDASIPEQVKSMVTYLTSLPENFTGELLTGDNPEEIKTYNDLETSLKRYSKGMEMSKYYSPKSIRVFERVKSAFIDETMKG